MSNYWPLKILLLIFIAPLLTAFFILKFSDPLQYKTTQYGTLIQPPLYLDNASFTPNKWHVVYLQPDDCDTTCQQQKSALHKLHVALGVDRERVIVSSMTNKSMELEEKSGSILLIDPLGFYMMHYAPGSKLSGLLKDLKRLLKYSHTT